jgi:hypothetical protein
MNKPGKKKNPFTERTLNKLERLFLNILQVIYDKPQLTLYSMVKNGIPFMKIQTGKYYLFLPAPFRKSLPEQ